MLIDVIKLFALYHKKYIVWQTEKKEQIREKKLR